MPCMYLVGNAIRADKLICKLKLHPQTFVHMQLYIRILHMEDGRITRWSMLHMQVFMKSKWQPTCSWWVSELTIGTDTVIWCTSRWRISCIVGVTTRLQHVGVPHTHMFALTTAFRHFFQIASTKEIVSLLLTEEKEIILQYGNAHQAQRNCNVAINAEQLIHIYQDHTLLLKIISNWLKATRTGNKQARF